MDAPSEFVYHRKDLETFPTSDHASLQAFWAQEVKAADPAHDGSDSEQGTATTAAETEASQAARVLGRYFDSSDQSIESKYRFVVRPDNPEAVKLKVVRTTRLTPADYERNVFHVVLRVDGTPVAGYDPGDSLAIYPVNPADAVSEFLEALGFEGSTILELDSFFIGEDEGTYVMTLEQVCRDYLDLFGCPTKSFYLALSKYARDIVERTELATLSLDRCADALAERVARSVTFASTLVEFPSLVLTPKNLLDIVPLMKPRLYSVASSTRMFQKEVHLLAVTHTWETSEKNIRTGLASGYLERLGTPGARVHNVVGALVRSAALKLPQQSLKPVVMAGIGTGMAPFRGFIEERAARQRLGEEMGCMRLYFGARHKHAEFLYEKELEIYEREGLLTLRCAWSRDQAEKVYVQNLIEEDQDQLWELLKPEVGGHFYVCGPTDPLPAIRSALCELFIARGVGAAYLDTMEADGRFSVEVY